MKNQCKMSGNIAMKPKYSQSYLDGLFSHGTHSLKSLNKLTRYPRGHAPQSLQLIVPFIKSIYRPQYKPGHFVLISVSVIDQCKASQKTNVQQFLDRFTFTRYGELNEDDRTKKS